MILALDYGEKRIGVAVTDDTGKYTKALDYIPNKSEVKRISAKGFPKGTTPDEIKDARREEKTEARLELRKVCNKLLYLINCHYPDKIIVGLPTIIDEETNQPKLGSQAKKIQFFMKKLELCLKQNKILVDIEFIEESMTSYMAEENLRAQGLTNDKIKERIDSESARILLEGYISNNNNSSSLK